MPKEIKQCNNCKSLNLKYIKNGYLECLDCGTNLDVFIAITLTVYTQKELNEAIQESQMKNKTVVCNNRECEHWLYEKEVGHARTRELDHTNCRIHTGEELLNGDCSGFEREDK